MTATVIALAPRRSLKVTQSVTAPSGEVIAFRPAPSPLNLAIAAWRASLDARQAADIQVQAAAGVVATEAERVADAVARGAPEDELRVLQSLHWKARLASALAVAARCGTFMEAMTGPEAGLDRALAALAPADALRAVAGLPAADVKRLRSIRLAKRAMRSRKAA